MYNPSLRKIIKNTIHIISFIVCISFLLFAQESALASAGNLNRESGSAPRKKKGNVIFKISSANPPSASSRKSDAEKEENLSELQRQARVYRAQGLAFQRIGNLDAAMELYQKAIELDPLYAVVYNDIGVLYEEIGLMERAEESYLRAVKIDQDFLSPYSNLALVYETKRDLDKAAFYWRKRSELGSSDDPWTQKAKQRLSDIRSILTDAPPESYERSVISLMKDVQNQKTVYRGDDRGLARVYLEKARSLYKKGDEVGALSAALDAKQLDSSNTEIDDFLEEAQTRLLTK